MSAVNSITQSPYLFHKKVTNGYYDEVFTMAGEPFKHWLPILRHFNERGSAALSADQENARKMRHEDGATINPFDDVRKPSTSWDLDIIPFSISSQEWSILEKGIEQRALLLEKILADTYGHQELLQQGKIPSELVFANPNFILPCHNIKPSGGRYLTYYAADLYRGNDGLFRVFKDYGSHPAGLGFALENRIVLSRLFPSFYHKTRIRRLAPFFQSFHRSLIRRAGLSKNTPDIVLFSPGPNSPYYFEHALLSRYLGYPLVEGQDLTVRDGKVFLKKLAGLEPVRSIFRHICDNESDPFALRLDTNRGVAGIIEVFREENIDIINPIGAGFIDTPLLKIFLPDLCQYLLGENLLIPNHPSWWCKSDEGLQRGLNIGSTDLIIDALFANTSPYSNDTMADAIRKKGADYLVTEPLQASCLPEWDEGQVGSCHTMIRVFACATEDGFTVMPGGLAITSNDPQQLLHNHPEVQKSKDIWVLSDEPVLPITLMDGFDSIPNFKRGSDLPSRVADNLLWLGRYLERAESLVRLLRPAYQFLLSEERPEDIPELPFLVNVLQALGVIQQNKEESPLSQHYKELPQELHKALFDKSSPESVITVLHRVQETARSVRDRLSTDSFRIINRLEDFSETSNKDYLDLLDNVLFTLNGFSGIAMETITRELGWRFLDMGRRLERAMHQSSLLNNALSLITKEPHSELQVLLEISHSLMTYRGRYRSSFQLAPVLDLLLLDETNPRSLAFQIQQINGHVEKLPRPGSISFASLEEKLALEMTATVRLLDLTSINIEELSEDKTLAAFFTTIDTLLARFSEQITAHYLSRVPSTPHYSGFSLRPSI